MAVPIDSRDLKQQQSTKVTINFCMSLMDLSRDRKNNLSLRADWNPEKVCLVWLKTDNCRTSTYHKEEKASLAPQCVPTGLFDWSQASLPTGKQTNLSFSDHLLVSHKCLRSMKTKHNLGSFLFYQSIISLVLRCFIVCILELSMCSL